VNNIVSIALAFIGVSIWLIFCFPTHLEAARLLQRIVKKLKTYLEKNTMINKQLIYPKTLFLFALLIITIRLHNQTVAAPIEDYHIDTSNTTKSHYKFGKVDIYLEQNKGIYPTYCNAWLKIEKNGKILHERKYIKIEPLGGGYGLFLPSKQPSQKYFLVNKKGDYNGRSLLIDQDGNLTDLPGGLYFITDYNRYLFIEHEVDCCGELRVFDLELGKVVFCISPEKNANSEVGFYESITYYKKDNNVFVIFSYNGDTGNKIFKYNYDTNTLVRDEIIKPNSNEIINLYSPLEIANNCSCLPEKQK
jgi:hypothetical protein